MPDRMLIVPVDGAAHQSRLEDASTRGTASDHLVIAIPDGMTTEQVRRAVRQLIEVTRQRPNDVNGL